MAKKVSDIMTELDISYQELKRNSDKLGIKVTGEGDSMEDRDAGRIISTINMLKGNDRPEAQSKKPKIKATPIISKPAPMAKKEREEAPKAAPVKAEAPKEEPGVASMWHFSNKSPQNSLELRPVFSILGKT